LVRHLNGTAEQGRQALSMQMKMIAWQYFFTFKVLLVFTFVKLRKTSTDDAKITNTLKVNKNNKIFF
jgi:uncharacterized membrane protein YvbJ